MNDPEIKDLLDRAQARACEIGHRILYTDDAAREYLALMLVAEAFRRYLNTPLEAQAAFSEYISRVPTNMLGMSVIRAQGTETVN